MELLGQILECQKVDGRNRHYKECCSLGPPVCGTFLACRKTHEMVTQDKLSLI